MKRLTIAAVGILAGFAFAGEKKQADTAQPVTIPEPLQEYYYEGLAPEKLAYCIDLWYDAALKGDDQTATKYEQMVNEILRNDLDSTQMELSLFAKQLDEFQRAEMNQDGAKVPDYKFSPEVLNAQELYSTEWESFKAKERLIGTIHQSDSFSNKYRLMSDYIEVLRRDVGLPKLKYAAGQLKTGQSGSPQLNAKPTSN